MLSEAKGDFNHLKPVPPSMPYDLAFVAASEFAHAWWSLRPAD